ncbi:hypothetical protein ADL22_31030 [Streptomyces sp. NRRL F-4489]|uniref:VanZ family protein n=1 Tax=Streptomyces sp. NRRL F-4489 TaxID=1609095 RepID=UPI000746C221|nr:VanZ family protein [Streptomyces sp. NRRL F-4489]KUL34116.1 hypothetical protein ADL22_31030 [Streptomyces sp. NRRL F-4489]
MSFSVALAAGCIGAAAIAVTAFALRRPRRPSHRVIAALGWLWVCGVAGLTFGTRSGGGQAVNLALLDTSNPADVHDFILNMIMFVPGGALLAGLRTPLWAAGLCGFLGSLTIETTQYLARTGRTADINDLLSNTLGCLAGFACAALIRLIANAARRPVPSPR